MINLPQKSGFVPTTAEWDQLVRIAENLAAQLAQAQASAVETARIVGAERDAARAWRDNFKGDLDAANAGLSAAIVTCKSITADRDKALNDAHKWATLANTAANERDAARAEVARLTAENDFLNGGAVADKQGIDILLAENERLTAVLTALINQADVAWATLDHTENERFVSRLGDAIDNARMALRQPAPTPEWCVCGHTDDQHCIDDSCAEFNCDCGFYRPAPARGQE